QLSRGQVHPQACNDFDKVGCALGPLGWCAPAGLGGPGPFRDCVAAFDKAAGSHCVDCIPTLDPRDPDRGTSGYSGVSCDTAGNCTYVGYSDQPLSSPPPSVSIGPPPPFRQAEPPCCRICPPAPPPQMARRLGQLTSWQWAALA